MKPHVVPLWYGRIGYRRALYEQSVLATKLKALLNSENSNSNIKDELKKQNFCMLLEHFPVYTCGVRQDTVTKEDEKRFLALGAEFYRTDRGGLITFHGPGQLIVYPILNLGNWNKVGAVKWYVNTLERTLCEVCSVFDIQARTTEHNGVWVGNNKIAAIGIHVKRYVTSHGISLNCNTDLSWFEHIVPCGIPGKGVTSLSLEVGRTIKSQDVAQTFLSAFESSFACTVDPIRELDANNF